MSEFDQDVELENVDRGDDLPEFPEETDLPEDQSAESEDQSAKSEEQGAKDKGITIPKSRFDAAQAKHRAREKELLEQLEAFKSSQKKEQEQEDISTKQVELDTLRDSYEEALIDGDRDEARKIRAQIVKMEQELINHTVTERSNQAREATKEDLRFDKALNEIESNFPHLNPDSDEFDADATTEVAQLMEGLMRSGVDRVTALQRAVKYVAGEPKAADTASALRDKRREEAIDKSKSAAAKQPADLIGDDHDAAGKVAADVKRMSDKAFNSLSEEEMARLRGDIL